MNILIVDSTFWTDAPNRDKTLKHVTSWVKNAYVTIVTTPRATDFYKEKLSPEILKKVDFIKIPFAHDYIKVNPLLVIFEYLRRIFGSRFIKLDKDYVIYTITGILTDVAIASSIKAKNSERVKSIVVTYDNFVPPPQKRPGNLIFNFIPYLAHKVAFFFLKKSDLIFAYMTEDNSQKLQMIVDASVKVKRFDNGVGSELLARVKDSAAKRYDIVHLGRIHVAKGIWDFINFVIECHKVNPNFKAAIVGKGDQEIEEKIRDFLDKHQLNGVIDFLGFVDVDTKYKILKESKIFISFSYDESYPVSVLEAIASELPMLLYNLEVYNNNPYRQSYHKIVPMGEFTKGMQWVLDIVNNFDKYSPEIKNHYKSHESLLTYEQNAESELQIMKGMFHGSIK